MLDRTKGILFILTSALGFALMAFFVRLCDNYGDIVPGCQKSFFRNIIAFAVAAAVFLSNGGKSPRKIIKMISPTLLLRSVLGTIGVFANFHALSYVPIAEGQSLNKTAPFFTVIFAWLFLGEKASKKQIFKILLAFTGTLLVLKPGFAGEFSMPLFVGLIGGIAAGGAYTCLSKLSRENCDGAFIVLFFSAFSSLASLPFVLFSPAPMNMAQVAALLGAGISAAIGQFGITSAYRYAKAREIAVYDYSNLLFTGILGFCFFNQLPDVLSIAGMLIIVLAAF